MVDESEGTNHENPADPELTDVELVATSSRRFVTVYDAVAGRAGPKGFLTEEQMRSPTLLSLAPEDVLARQTGIPVELVDTTHDPAAEVSATNKIPESEMLKAVHTYASDFYKSATANKGTYDFRSLDETALIAMGILLEEATREALGQTGDMVFVEPAGLEHGLDETAMTKHQIKGRVKPRVEPSDVDEDEDEDSAEMDESSAKRRRY